MGGRADGWASQLIRSTSGEGSRPGRPAPTMIADGGPGERGCLSRMMAPGASAERISPLPRVPGAHRVGRLIEFLMDRTDPSIIETLIPPGRRLVGFMPPSPSEHRNVLDDLVLIETELGAKRWAWMCRSRASVSAQVGPLSMLRLDPARGASSLRFDTPDSMTKTHLGGSRPGPLPPRGLGDLGKKIAT